MENKVLIKLVIPELDETYDVFVPVNEIMWKVKAMLAKCVFNMAHLVFSPNDEFILINKDNNKIYDNNEILINTDIRNGTELILVAK